MHTHTHSHTHTLTHAHRTRRPNEFLPTEFSVVRGLEQKMYREQEKLKSMKTHRAVHKAYVDLMARLPTYNTVFFPVRVSILDTRTHTTHTHTHTVWLYE